MLPVVLEAGAVECRVSRSRCESLGGINDDQSQVGKAKGVSAFRPLELKQS